MERVVDVLTRCKEFISTTCKDQIDEIDDVKQLLNDIDESIEDCKMVHGM